MNLDAVTKQLHKPDLTEKSKKDEKPFTYSGSQIETEAERRLFSPMKGPNNPGARFGAGALKVWPKIVKNETLA